MRHVRHTSALHVAVAVAVGLVVGTSVPEIAVRTGHVAPRPGWVAALALGALAFGLGWTARGTWRNLREDKRQMNSELGIRLLALAKASAIVGSLFLGGYLGYALMYLDAMDTVLGRERVLQSALAALAALAVVVMALWLERTLRLPEDDDPPPGASPTT
ncbi:DUF3180 domain-containing protein [Aeromicrobium sp. CTD01-1L150]|uniref:DUF3180 domain-containing protein n=1 Tax=Aeromicrobium sp. CTD01-1L150 TaxID=3341830 RepID=UPI0035BFFBF2